MVKKQLTPDSQLPASTAKPLIVIVGETASGKSRVGLELAKELDGEVISADSRLIYKGMDIGTAKPTEQEQTEVKHHLIDLVEPDEKFTVADFKHLALAAIDDIRRRGKAPIMVGGTGLYVDAVVFDYQFRSRYDEKIRTSLEGMTVPQLQKLVFEAGFEAESKDKNRRHLVRLLESGQSPGQDRTQMIDNVIMVGLQLSRQQLRKNIEARVEQMFRRGLRREVDELVQRYGWEHEALTGIGYREFEQYYLKEISMSALKRLIINHTLNYAKRQRTWFKRNPEIRWFDDAEQVIKFITNQVSKDPKR